VIHDILFGIYSKKPNSKKKIAQSEKRQELSPSKETPFRVRNSYPTKTGYAA
jgi:hypothetical protein